MDYKKISIEKHEEWKGKIEVNCRVPVETADDLSIAYTPGVAEPCLAIQKDYGKSFELTRRWNTVAVVTDGTAVLGLGDIGPEAAMPVMEGKCVLFKSFGDIDAMPFCIRSKDTDEIVNAITLFSGSWGGINLEDIAAPRCFEIEERLKKTCDIPIFHDDQHGTAIVTLAGLVNAMKIVGKKPEDTVTVISGAGAAGAAIARLMLKAGYKDIILCNSKGAVSRDQQQKNEELKKLAEITNPGLKKGSLADVMVGSDIFIGVSAPGIVTEDMVRSMNSNAIIFAMANPVPEIMPELAKAGGAAIIATGRSDFPNQINNVLAFPGIFRGALDVRASDINEEMKVAAAQALAELVSDSELGVEYLIPPAFDKRICPAVSKAVSEAAISSGVTRINTVITRD